MKAADDIREALGVSSINGFERAAVRQDIYDQVVLKDPEHPYSTVQMSPKERYAGTHLYYSRTAEFMLYDGATKTGYNLTEFLKLPTFMVENILSTLRQQSKDGRTGVSQMEKDIRKMGQEADQHFSNMKQR